MLALLGDWSDPLKPETHHSLIVSVIDHWECRCAYCGFQSSVTPNATYGRLNVCLYSSGLAPELNNCVPLCDFCVNLTDLDTLDNNGDPLGTFVELPWIRQSELNCLLRGIYAYEYLASHPESRLFNSPIHQACGKLIADLTRQAKEWAEYGFDGSPASLKAILDGYTGYKEDRGGVQYIDRLRFLFFDNHFKESIIYWSGYYENAIQMSEATSNIALPELGHA